MDQVINAFITVGTMGALFLLFFLPRPNEDAVDKIRTQLMEMYYF